MRGLICVRSPFSLQLLSRRNLYSFSKGAAQLESYFLKHSFVGVWPGHRTRSFSLTPRASQRTEHTTQLQKTKKYKERGSARARLTLLPKQTQRPSRSLSDQGGVPCAQRGSWSAQQRSREPYEPSAKGRLPFKNNVPTSRPSGGPTNWVSVRQQREGDEQLRRLRADWKGDILYGVNPVSAALKASRRELYNLYLQEGMVSKAVAPELQRILRLAREAQISVHHVSKHYLNILTDNSAHQGIVLDCSPMEFLPLDDFGQASPKTGQARPDVWIALDEVTDPHNLGAVLRSAYFLGAHGVLTCARNSAPLSPAVSKASAGAMEHFPVHSCRAMQKTLQVAADNGWDVLGAAAGQDSLRCSDHTVGKSTIVVLGSEHRGLRTLVRRACTALIKVDSVSEHSVAEGIDSLNVSVAAGILLHQFIVAQKGAA